MPVLYDSQKLVPAPFIGIEKTYQKTSDGTTVGVLYNITIQGTTMAWRGSPDSTGSFWTLSGEPPDEVITADSRQGAIQRKQEAIKELFGTDGLWFEIQPWDGSASTKCKPRVISITFAEGLWYEVFSYTIVLQTDELFINGQTTIDTGFDYKISDANESWQVEFNEAPENPFLTNTFRVTHNISAVGKRFYDDSNNLIMPAWQQARGFVQQRTGYDYSFIASSGALNVPNFYTGYNHVIAETIDEFTGNYGINESWILASGNALEELTIEVNSSIQDALTHVSVNGSIQGLETRDANYQIAQHKYDAANQLFAQVDSMALQRAQNYAGVSLNPYVASSRVGRNPTTGTITYGYEYDNRPTNCVPGAKSEIITIIDNYPTDIFASLGILGRPAGPLLQPINTISQKQRQLNVELIMPPTGNCGSLAGIFMQPPDITTIISAATGLLSFTQIFIDQNQGSWEPRQGRYSRNISWTYQ